VPGPEAIAVATLILAAFRGLMLDLLQTGERDRVDAGFEVLASIMEKAAAARDTASATPPKR
jgi:hypothetical protein